MHLHLGSGAVPAIFDAPSVDAPVPGVLLIHGLGSTKEQMTGSIGRALLRRGVAALAIDLPLHGTRATAELDDMRSRMNPIAAAGHWRAALREAGEALRYLESRPEVDAGRIGIAGYSLGAYLSLAVAARERAVSAVALAAGGDLPADIPFAHFVRVVVDPQRLVRGFEGRPLLMVNGRYDRRVRPEQAERLFAAAAEPKELRWYQGGHWPPADVIEAVAEWLTQRLASTTKAARRTPRTKAPKRS